MEQQDSSALPALFFEPEDDSNGQPSPEESTPPDSTLFPKPSQRNEPKLSLSSYQSVTSGEEIPTDLKDSDINEVTEKLDTPDVSNIDSPKVFTKSTVHTEESASKVFKTSTPVRHENEVSHHIPVLENSSQERPRTTSRVSFEKTNKVIDPKDVRVPVTGFEIMEQRARFTVFKLHVHKGRHDNWFVFRRYTDFLQLQKKLKILFPRFHFVLPAKRLFRDNYDRSFLEDRQLALQAFIDSILSHKETCNSQPVQEFFCLNDPPGPLDSLEEGRAYCESLENSVYSLKKDLKQKDKELELLKEELTLYKSQVEMLSRALREKNENGAKKSALSPANSMAECDHLAPEADQSQGKMTVEAEIHQSDKRRLNDTNQSQSKKQLTLNQKDTDTSHSKPFVTTQS